MRETPWRTSPGQRVRSEDLPTELPSWSKIFIPCCWLKKLILLKPFVAYLFDPEVSG